MSEDLRELDARVAERLFSFRPHRWESQETAGGSVLNCRRPGCIVRLACPPWSIEKAPRFCLERHDSRGDGLGAQVPHYSSTWEGMGLVVERMRELGWHFTGRCGRYLEGDGYSSASFHRGSNSENSRGPWDLRESTSRAALGAVGEK